MFTPALLIALIIIAIVLTICIAAFADGNGKSRSTVATLALLLLLSCFFAIVSAYDVGNGRIPSEAEEFTKRLKTGTAYQFLASSKDGSDQVILVKKIGASNFYALRVKEVPPEHFTLIDGKLVAIAPPTPPVGVK